jgi:hypothetical protein
MVFNLQNVLVTINDELLRIGVSETVAAQLIQCLIDAGVVFGTERDTIRTLR